MLVSVLPPLPPSPHLHGAPDVASAAAGASPWGAVAEAAGGVVGGIFSAIKGSQDAAKQRRLEAQALHAEKVAQDQQFAVQKGQALIAPATQKRQGQIYALYAVGGVAALITLVVVVNAARKKK